MEKFLDRFNGLINGRPESDGEIAESIGVSKQALSAWKTGTRSPKRSTIIKLAEYFGVSVPWLMGLDDDQTPSAIRIPVLGSIPAGVPIEAVEDILDWEELPLSWGRGGKEYFGLVVRGNSMYPRYEAG